MITTILRYNRDGTIAECDDEVTEEYPITLYVNGVFAGRIASSGDLADAAAVGHAVAQGWARPEQILAVTHEGQSAFLTLSQNAPGPDAATSMDIDCISAEALAEHSPVPAGFSVAAQQIQKLAEQMQHSALHWSLTGGVHAAAVAQGESIFCCEDISRHTALDKVIGYAVLHSWKLDQAVLMGTGRIPAQAVIQAAQAGIPILASRSATTAQAIVAAERMGITIIGFVRAGRMNVYTHPERITA